MKRIKPFLPTLGIGLYFTILYLGCHSSPNQPLFTQDIDDYHIEVILKEPESFWDYGDSLLVSLDFQGTRLLERCPIGHSYADGCQISSATFADGQIVYLYEHQSPDVIVFILDVNAGDYWPCRNHEQRRANDLQFTKLIEEHLSEEHRLGCVFRGVESSKR